MFNKCPIAKRLKEARIMAGLSQKKLGILAGIDEFSASARMNQYETGKHNPDYSTLSKIAKVLKIPVAYFYSKDDNLAEIIRIFGNTNKNKRNKLFAFLKKLNNYKPSKIP